MQTINLYNNTIQIEFDEAKHSYKRQGVKIPSVTSITGQLDKSNFLMPWAVNLAGSYLKQYIAKSQTFIQDELLLLIDEACAQYKIKQDEAKDIGSQVHSLIHQYIQDPAFKLPDGLPIGVLNGMNGFIDWYNGNELKFISQEEVCYSAKHNYVGIFDAVLQDGKRKILCDFKSGSNIYPENFWQLAAYLFAYNEENHDDKLKAGVILHCNKKNGRFKAHWIEIKDLKKHYQIFLALLKVKNLLA